LTIFGFQSYQIVQEYFIGVLVRNESEYTKFEKHFNSFLLHNFADFASTIFELLPEQPKIIKVFYFLMVKLN
jgi:hypothetical protein